VELQDKAREEEKITRRGGGNICGGRGGGLCETSGSHDKEENGFSNPNSSPTGKPRSDKQKSHLGGKEKMGQKGGRCKITSKKKKMENYRQVRPIERKNY